MQVHRGDELPTFEQCLGAANDDLAKSFDAENFDFDERNLAVKQSIAAALVAIAIATRENGQAET